MADVTAVMVKALREKTGAGMMDCKTALIGSDGNEDVAVDWLRTKGLAKAAKKATRTASEGLIGIALSGTIGAIVEVNSETDFVARNKKFQNLVENVAKLALCVEGNIDRLASLPFSSGKETIEEHIQSLVGSVGENLALRRSAYIKVEEGIVAGYVHSAIVPNLGRLCTLVGLESSGDKGKLLELGDQIAMHVAASAPLATSISDLDPEIVERERAIYMQQAREGGKPENVVKKMVDGRMQKFYAASVLLLQPFVIDNEKSVEEVVREAEPGIGAPIRISSFARLLLGEGIEKQELDFASEVAGVVSGS
ncbi:MAG: translation elongation factor Ts [Alphaproteobacteria bacterium]|nr:translation elongation factor Ts [Alphaproteobacteria bacterium]